MHILVLTPVLDDWVSARDVLDRLDTAFLSRPDRISVLLVDDGSAEPPPADFARGPYSKLERIEILRLKKNVGHQRALAVGLCHIAEKISCDAILVMDGDGEDDPRDAVRLVVRLDELRSARPGAEPLVFAERTRRSESAVFRLGYLGYRFLHVLLTGRGIKFGNFSIIPRARLGALVTEPKLWNHYAASVAASRVPHTTIPSHRGQRVAGKSRLNFVGLAVHGLSALSCYNEIIGVRMIMASSLLFVLSVLGLTALISLRLATNLAVPGWTSVAAGLVVIFLLQVITLAANFTMQIINMRTAQPFLPLRDSVWYVDGIQTVFARNS